VALPLALAVFLLLPGSVFSEEKKWTRITSPNFELFTTAGEKKGREAVLYFEQVRSFFLRASGGRSTSGLPVRIVAFRSEKEFKPYRPAGFAAAYYLGGHDRDYIVMQSIRREFYPGAVHEYVHLLVKHSGTELAVWLNEGLAELYSTLTPVAGKVRIGDILPGPFQLLRRSKLLDVEILTAVDRDSPHYNERDRAGLFYAQSWALTHMLNLSEAYRPKFSQFLKILASGAPASSAFQQVYGKSMQDVQKDLAAYIDGDRFYAGVVSVKFEKAAEKPEVRAATSLESGMALANLLAAAKKEDQAKQMYESLAQENPDSREVEEALGYLALQGHETTEARRHFARAVELGSTNAKLYVDYSVLLHSAGEAASVIDPLKKALELKPDFEEAHYYLGLAFYERRNFRKAVDHLRRVTSVSGERAFQLYRALSYATYRIGLQEEAKEAAEWAKEHATTPDQVSAAEELLQYVSKDPRLYVEQIPLPAVTAQARPPRLVRTSKSPADSPPKPAPAKPQSQPHSIEGMLQQVDCLGEVARFWILAGGRRVALAILDPTRVVIKGSDSGTFDFSCGPQQPRGIVLEYERQEDKKLGTVGVIKYIEFR
jgi:Flp pilus assembly protein TadD